MSADHPDIAAAPVRGPRCKFGRPHTFVSFARDGVFTDDVYECYSCGAIADDRPRVSLFKSCTCDPTGRGPHLTGCELSA